MKQSIFIIAASCLIFACSRLLGDEGARVIQPAPDAPQPLSPAASAAKLQIPEGFRIELVASEPVVEEPSCIAFDERGRMFVCELHGYNIEGHIDVSELNKTGVLDKEVRRIRWELQGGEIAEQAAMQQYGVLKMLVDTDADGVMDHAEVWADDLPSCYGVVAARGGVIVTCAPDIIFFADRDGDGKVDQRQTLFTGFRKRVMERGINNPRWGLDNWIYVGCGGEGGTITGPNLTAPVQLGNTDFRIKPDGSAIEPVNGRVGTFGMTVNDVGDRFPSGGGQPATYALPLPYRYLKRNPWVPTPPVTHSAVDYNRGFRISDPHPWRVKRGRDPQWVKFYGARETNSNYFSGGCSNEYYGDKLFPSEYHGNLFYCEPSLNIVHRCVVERDGAGYRGSRAEENAQSEFLASTDQWFRPMNLRVGPQGALYIVDMYREIIEDYSAIPRFLQQQYGLDKGGDYGRIWRLVPDADRDAERSRPVATDLSQLDNNQLAEQLHSPHRWVRQTASRLLVERRGVSVAKRMAEMIRPDTPMNSCIVALHTLDGLDRLAAAEVLRALRHDHYGVRLHGLRLSERWLESNPAVLDRVTQMTNDDDPSVRLQVALTLGESQRAQAVTALLSLAERYGDERWMDSAIVSSASRHAGSLLMGLLATNRPSERSRSLLRSLAATLGGQREGQAIGRLLTKLIATDEQTQTDCLTGLVEGASSGSRPPAESKDGFAGLARLLESDSAGVRNQAAKLASLVRLADDKQLKVIFAEAARNSGDPRLSVAQRREALQTLESAPFQTLFQAARPLLDSRQPVAVQMAAARALGSTTDRRVAAVLLQNWPSYSPSVRAVVMETILGRGDRQAALLDAVQQDVIQLGEINAIGREQLLTSKVPGIAERARELLDDPAAGDELKDRVARYQAALERPPNVDRGKQVFAKHCLACHKLGGEGHDIGPNLGTIVNRPNETLLMDLLDPSGRIEPEYRSYIVVTEDGRSLTGVLASESATSILLRKEKGQSESVLRAEIDAMKASRVSLMPSNFHELISPAEAADLIGFMRRSFREPENRE